MHNGLRFPSCELHDEASNDVDETEVSEICDDECADMIFEIISLIFSFASFDSCTVDDHNKGYLAGRLLYVNLKISQLKIMQF